MHRGLEGLCDGILGLYALSRIDCVIDGVSDRLWAAQVECPPLPYHHNRLGLAFAPRSGFDEPLLAVVESGTPAHRSGLRPGDRLISIN